MDHPRGGARDLSEALAARAEDLCRRYLPGGRRNGAYWTVGDVHGTPGRSLFVRLVGPASGRGAAGRWCDAATGQRGDLLDLIALNRGHARLRDVLDEARSVLALPPAAPRPATWASASGQRADTVEAARRLYRAGRPIRGTPAERYLAARGIALDGDAAAVLRFHPAAHYRDAPGDPRRSLPALLAPVIDLAGTLTGLHRTFLDPRPGRGADAGLLGKAPIASPRRSLGRLAGQGVHLRRGDGTAWLVGEGIETALSVASLFPRACVVAALSASQLAILVLPPGLVRLVVARDNDAAGREAAERLAGRARASSVTVDVLRPRLIDFNADLRRWGPVGLAERVGAQLSGA
ncbi:DUF7146 domain-containing protein [Lichenibacterium dinghuense]|uniref:DUF7146 domain-containing protein n=1 Tax=Lichenibacterium dinghuense TaxID=2895977 RepID=UPI001F2DFC9F|nr:toprim domain-containing protein [Lichenibacterium sp. 6Y81]